MTNLIKTYPLASFFIFYGLGYIFNLIYWARRHGNLYVLDLAVIIVWPFILVVNFSNMICDFLHWASETVLWKRKD